MGTVITLDPFAKPKSSDENTQLKIQRALVSVSDKRGLVEFAQKLLEYNVEIISTGGTYNTLKNANIKVTSVSEVTGFPGNSRWSREDVAPKHSWWNSCCA